MQTSARALWAFDALLLNAIQLIKRAQPAAPGPYVDMDLSLPQDVLLTHRRDEHSALRVRAGKLGCAAIFQFAAALNYAEEQGAYVTPLVFPLLYIPHLLPSRTRLTERVQRAAQRATPRRGRRRRSARSQRARSQAGRAACGVFPRLAGNRLSGESWT